MVGQNADGWLEAFGSGANLTIDSNAEARDLTDDWTVANNAPDLFVVRVTNGADGWAPVIGPCNKNAKGMTGAVVSLNGSAANSGDTFAHEMGHYLGLSHIPDNGTSSATTGRRTASPGSTSGRAT